MKSREGYNFTHMVFTYHKQGSWDSQWSKALPITQKIKIIIFEVYIICTK